MYDACLCIISGYALSTASLPTQPYVSYYIRSITLITLHSITVECNGLRSGAATVECNVLRYGAATVECYSVMGSDV